MKTIIIYKDKPIYTSNDLVCWWTVAKCIYKNTIKPLNDKDFDEWRSRATIRGEHVEPLLKAFNVKVWKWNQVAQDWYLID